MTSVIIARYFVDKDPQNSVHSFYDVFGLAGIRDSNKVGDVTYSYLTLDGKVVRQTWTDDEGDHTFDIIYDNCGQPYAFMFDKSYYLYVLNQQGDVIRIIDQSGTAVAEYSYDAWGNLLVDEEDLSDIGHVNPIRYRGYYYDTETGFYYLQSRYYDPSIGRFINADSFAALIL